jgi:hypothetical protein
MELFFALLCPGAAISLAALLKESGGPQRPVSIYLTGSIHPSGKENLWS